MIRFLPIYNYTTRPHRKPVEYELDKEYLNKTFEDFVSKIQSSDNGIALERYMFPLPGLENSPARATSKNE
jgi:hypothetical protein